MRRRAFGKLATGATNVAQYDLVISVDLDFEKEIREERMREFAFEQMRKADLIRWGIFILEMKKVVDMIDAVPPSSTNAYCRDRFANALYSRHLIWPIPAVEIMMNRAMIQNPNW